MGVKYEHTIEYQIILPVRSSHGQNWLPPAEKREFTNKNGHKSIQIDHLSTGIRSQPQSGDLWAWVNYYSAPPDKRCHNNYGKNMKKWGGHTGCVTEDPFLLGDWVFKSSWKCRVHGSTFKDEKRGFIISGLSLWWSEALCFYMFL